MTVLENFDTMYVSEKLVEHLFRYAISRPCLAVCWGTSCRNPILIIILYVRVQGKAFPEGQDCLMRVIFVTMVRRQLGHLHILKGEHVKNCKRQRAGRITQDHLRGVTRSRELKLSTIIISPNWDLPRDRNYPKISSCQSYG